MKSALELRQVSKIYGSGPTEVDALRTSISRSNAASSWRSWGRAALARARY